MRPFYFMAGALLVGAFGCAPELAQKPLGEDEVRWEKYVKKNYSSWTPPQTIPPDKILNPTPLDKGEVVLTPGGATAPAEDSAAPVVQETPSTPAEPVVVADEKSAAPAPVAATPETPSAKTELYTVAKNDSLSRIAKKFNTTTARIKAANQKALKGSDRIYPGMKLQIPAR